jgi:hypothetical protein
MALAPDLTDATPTVLTKLSRLQLDPPGQMVMDAKALFDNISSEQQNADDERASLEVSLIKEDMVTLGCVPRWVPHDKNPTDGLTKADGAHMVPLQRLLATSKFAIRAEAEELTERKEVKDRLGYVPRPRASLPSGCLPTAVQLIQAFSSWLADNTGQQALDAIADGSLHLPEDVPAAVTTRSTCRDDPRS